MLKPIIKYEEHAEGGLRLAYPPANCAVALATLFLQACGVRQTPLARIEMETVL